MANPSDSYLQASGLPAAWASQNAWRILDTDWQDGVRFLACKDAWERDPHKPRMLHYVGLVTGESQSLSPGFHRLHFNAGQVLLTLCAGELKPMLRAQDFWADTVFLGSQNHPVWDDWTINALLRCCRRGTQLVVRQTDAAFPELLTRHGFEVQPRIAPHQLQARFNPRWLIKSTRRHAATPRTQPSRCVVIGAGLAGASTAAALARRGWQVQVLDAAARPASAASALPLGLLVPPPAHEQHARAQLLRAGVALSLQQAREHLRSAQDWAPSGIMTTKPSQAAYWEPGAAWIKPHRLVQAWLAQPGIRFRGDARVLSMDCPDRKFNSEFDGEWILRDAQNAVLAQAGLVVLACAGGVQNLLAGHNITLRQPMSKIHGQVSWALQQESDHALLPPFPLNGLGHVVPDVPLEAGPAWFAGATYALEDAMPTTVGGHESNLARLDRLHPPSAQVMAARMRDGSIQTWQGTRFATQDRMPLVGRLDARALPRKPTTLYINSGYGSRGLSWCVLCAELLAAQLCNEPLPIPHTWARLLRGGR